MAKKIILGPDSLKTAYKRCFGTMDGKRVLDDIEKFCKFEKSGVRNTYDDAREEGKQLALLHIRRLLIDR